MGNITRDQHKFLSFAAEQIRKAQVEWGIPHSFIEAASDGLRYRMDDVAKDFDNKIEAINRSASIAIYKYIDELTDAMRSIRRDQQRRKEYQPVVDHGTKGSHMASRVLSVAFQRSTCEVYIRKNPEFDLGFENEGKDYWKKIFVTISCSWNKVVNDRGIAIIRSSSGLRFVYSARIKKFDHINDDMTTVYEVKTFGIKNKQAFADNGWLLVYGQASAEKPVYDASYTNPLDATNNVHAFHRTLGDCKALFDRRVKAHVLKELEAV